MLMSAINPRDKDICLVKQYKERIHGDVGGSWVIKAQVESVTDELEAAKTTGDPHTSLEMQTKQEIFSPRAEHLQAGSSKVHIGGEIPLNAALRLERWAAQDKYAISTTHFANETHPVGQYPKQMVTEPNLGCSLWPNHLGFRTDGLTYHRRETPKAFHENNCLEGPSWNARGLILETWPELVNSKTNGKRNEFENEGFNFVRSQDDWDLSFSEDQLHPSALEMHHPMPPLEKKEFTPLRNIKGIGKVVNPFARESSCQISQPLRASEVLPQQPAIQQTVHVPPPVVVETAPQDAGLTPPDPARVPAEQYWRLGTQEYRPYVAEPTYDYLNCASTYRGYGGAKAPGGPLGGPPYGGVTQMGGISDGNLERERGSRNGSFRGGSRGGGPGGLGGPGGPGSPGGPPNDPDNWGSNHDAYWHPANGWVAV
ncbi:hypothetical protein GYMLUDRAFT_252927 [Collybiopsis luxurians FD-317 M1]|uniref:Uncharacterized protein n=1 Tax=Collybiopsis luxurians FD-317 M1 TaxID=944289 RepID=A0A0D0AK19_9AGAR|nr:hypothetical protein GYMLUDRAFT_252927 [Collybiopsis luxurians FD-317 M1]